MHHLTKNYFITAAIGVVILILILAIVNPSMIRIALALPLILFLPGYGLTAVLFPRRALDIPTRLLLSVGLSLAMTAFSGLILHLTLWGISLQNPLVVLLIGGPAILGLYSVVKHALQLDKTTILTRIGFNWRQVLLLMLAAIIAVTAVTVARIPTSPKNLVGYTLFWGKAGNAPDRLELGVRSEEFQTTKYQILFELNGIVRAGPTLELKPGESWEGVLRLPSEQVVGSPLTVFLYRSDHTTEPYRHIVWWPQNR